MIEYDTNSRLQLAQQRVDTLAAEMRRSRRLTRDAAGYPRWGKLAADLFGRVAHPRGDRSRHVPAYDA